ncbi:peroxidase 57-like [Chenopodium quinoa]|uniref:peroxidase 57-like n=1 Tax=Chenopodium quinoa TaxID=63459 RepID=UPI000B790E6A|nr:peroxidase 57-like [Chenopodium quinoa]
MKLHANFGLVMLTLGLVLVSTPMAQCATIFGVKVENPFSKPSKEQPMGDSPALSPSFGPALAPAPGPSMSSRRSGPFWFSTTATSGLVVGFYDDKCNSDVEDIIDVLCQEEFDQDPTILPALLRLQFHDCFVHGCDASILIDGTSTEKTSDSNGGVRGYEFIEKLKTAIESECPGVVSCADIIAVATKVLIRLGGGLDFPVETGRRDGLVSISADVNLPNPSMTVEEAAAVFAAKNFTVEEMVILLGYHSVGNAHCKFFEKRLYEDTGEFDSEMDLSLLNKLRKVCPQNQDTTNNIALLNQDFTNNNTLNNRFYGELIGNRGVLKLDQELSRDPASSAFVSALSQNSTLFNIRKAEVMIKLQAVEVLTGSQGEIRKVCSSFN